jgi:hypothetical protein
VTASGELEQVELAAVRRALADAGVVTDHASKRVSDAAREHVKRIDRARAGAGR